MDSLVLRDADALMFRDEFFERSVVGSEMRAGGAGGTAVSPLTGSSGIR